MRDSKLNYAVVGAFVIAMLVGLVVAVATLTGRTGAVDNYFAVYSNVTGVKFGTQVLYEGYPIGQVEEVTPVVEGGAMKFRVDFSVNEGWKIPDDSVARIGAAGLLSAITINIDAGRSPTPLSPGTMVIGLEASDLFSAMSEVASEVSTLAEKDIRPLLANINKLTLEMTDRIPRIVENADIAAGNFATLSSDLIETRTKFDEMLGHMSGMVGENRLAVRQSVADMRHVTDSVARHIDQVNQNLDGTARNMYEFSRQIRQNPGLLLGGTPPEDRAVVR